MGLEQDNIYPMLDPEPELIDFSGGFKYSASLFDIQLNQSPDCKNVYWREGALWQLDGTSKFDSNVISGAPDVTGLFVYGQESSATNFVLAATGNKVWQYSSGWVDKTGVYALTGGSQHFGLTFNDIFIGVTSSRDAPYKKDGSGDIAALGGSPPSGKVIFRMGEFIIIANTAANPSYAYYCDPGNPESGWDKFFDVKSDDTQGITGGGSLDRTTAFIFKERTATRIQHIGGLSFNHDDNYLPVGLVAQATLQKCTVSIEKRAVSVLLGLSESGVYAFDGSQNPIKISDNINFKFDRSNSASWNRTHWSKAHATYDPSRNWYWLFVPSASSEGEMDECWICDLSNFTWWQSDPDSSASSAMINDANGKPQLHVGGYDGYVRKFDKDTKNFDGVAIDSYLRTTVIDFKKTVRLRQLIPYASQKGNWNLDFETRWGLNQAITSSDALLLTSGGGLYGTGTYGSATYGDGRPVFKNLAGMNYTGRYLQIKFGNSRVNENFNLFKIGLPARLIGGRVGQFR